MLESARQEVVILRYQDPRVTPTEMRPLSWPDYPQIHSLQGANHTLEKAPIMQGLVPIELLLPTRVTHPHQKPPGALLTPGQSALSKTHRKKVALITATPRRSAWHLVSTTPDHRVLTDH